MWHHYIPVGFSCNQSKVNIRKVYFYAHPASSNSDTARNSKHLYRTMPGMHYWGTHHSTSHGGDVTEHVRLKTEHTLQKFLFNGVGICESKRYILGFNPQMCICSMRSSTGHLRKTKVMSTSEAIESMGHTLEECCRFAMWCSMLKLNARLQKFPLNCLSLRVKILNYYPLT